MLYCVVGPSGSGKSTLVEELNKLGYKSPDSYTTRPKRNPQEKGHTFISDNEFDRLEDVVAFTVFNGYRYCVTKQMLQDCDFYIVDPPGVETLKINGEIPFKVIGLELEASDCAVRMLSRGDSADDVMGRLDNDWWIFREFDNICDYKLDATKDIPELVQEVLSIVNN